MNALLVPLILLAGAADAALARAGSDLAELPQDGEGLYATACAACHGADGRGAPKNVVGFEEELPDFTDCRFANREPDGDWWSVAHQGGPVRGFSQMMPAFGGALSEEQLFVILGHIRGMCGDDRWPRGELNLPRPLVTTKAYPEDEMVLEAGTTAEGEGEVTSRLVYEKRFGPSNQFELIVPFTRREQGTDSDTWDSGIGDVAVAYKRALHHSFERGTIFSVVAEAVLPTGDEERGLGKGYTVFEPFLAFGALLPKDSFLHLQGGLELPVNEPEAHDDAFLRAAIGKTWRRTPHSRAYSPMFEVLLKRELTSGADLQWDVVPQVQIALNTRQHVLANVGVRIPLDDSSRSTEVLFYILWDWFDGGFFQGW